MVAIRAAQFPTDREAIRGLLREYFSQLAVPSCFEDFDRELANLPGECNPPRGAFLVAAEDLGGLVGCVGLRPLGPDLCEMKRLFLTGSARGAGVGRRLAESIVDVAQRLGYRAMRLDTLPSQQSAQRIYGALGFTDIAPYRHNPVVGTRFLELRFDANPPLDA